MIVVVALLLVYQIWTKLAAARYRHGRENYYLLGTCYRTFEGILSGEQVTWCYLDTRYRI